MQFIECEVLVIVHIALARTVIIADSVSGLALAAIGPLESGTLSWTSFES